MKTRSIAFLLAAASALPLNCLASDELVGHVSTHSHTKGSASTETNESSEFSLSTSLSKAKIMGLMPDALLVPDMDTKAKHRRSPDAERAELTDLWEATITQSKDIQFVIQRLQPNTDKHWEASQAVKYVSGALFDFGVMTPFLLPAPLVAKDSAVVGLGTMRKVFNDRFSSGKKSGMSTEQATLLYYMVRQTAGRLVTSYRNYRMAADRLAARKKNLADLQKGFGLLDDNVSPAAALGMRYLNMQALSSLEDAEDQLDYYRQQLVELAGEDGTTRMEQQIADETKTAQIADEKQQSARTKLIAAPTQPE